MYDEFLNEYLSKSVKPMISSEDLIIYGHQEFEQEKFDDEWVLISSMESMTNQVNDDEYGLIEQAASVLEYQQSFWPLIQTFETRHFIVDGNEFVRNCKTLRIFDCKNHQKLAKTIMLDVIYANHDLSDHFRHSDTSDFI